MLRLLKEKAKVPTVPGSDGPLNTNESRSIKIAERIGYPVIIKAAAGGGGRGMRVVENENDLVSSIKLTQNEAKAAFGDGTVYLEKFLGNPRHVEIQVLADGNGKAIHLGDRDCSLQRRHQKIIEEAPAPLIPDDVREEVYDACINACLQIGYEGGLLNFCMRMVIFIIEKHSGWRSILFKMITGVDIVKEQLSIASNMSFLNMILSLKVMLSILQMLKP